MCVHVCTCMCRGVCVGIQFLPSPFLSFIPHLYILPPSPSLSLPLSFLLFPSFVSSSPFHSLWSVFLSFASLSFLFLRYNSLWCTWCAQWKVLMVIKTTVPLYCMSDVHVSDSKTPHLFVPNCAEHQNKLSCMFLWKEDWIQSRRCLGICDVNCLQSLWGTALWKHCCS